MTRTLALTLTILLLLSGCAWADDPASEGAAPKDDATAARLKENPDNSQALQTYVLLQARQILPLLESDAEQAEKRLNTLKEFVNSLEPKTEAGQSVVEQAKGYVQSIDQRLKLARTSLDELEAQLKSSSDDADLLALYQAKAMSDIYPLAMYQPAEAEKQLGAVTAFLEERAESADEPVAKARFEAAVASLTKGLSRPLEQGSELAKTLNQPAAPLAVEAWVNGEALTDDDLKGKVVLLDFWAVWCGPCIATFPHLREWQEHYGDQGLVMIGLTRYYNFTWDDQAQRASRSAETVAAEQEQKMLQQFAEHHELKHRFAIQKDDSLSEFYRVTGIPHVVLLDREGKVRLFRIGSGEQNAKDLEAEIKKLLAEGQP